MGGVGKCVEEYLIHPLEAQTIDHKSCIVSVGSPIGQVTSRSQLGEINAVHVLGVKDAGE